MSRTTGIVDAREQFHKEMRRQKRVQQAGRYFFYLLLALSLLLVVLCMYLCAFQ